MAGFLFEIHPKCDLLPKDGFKPNNSASRHITPSGFTSFSVSADSFSVGSNVFSVSASTALTDFSRFLLARTCFLLAQTPR
ncbi:hypothetical protein A4R26_14360 [Niastella populi]|uniref:Uncharacterized protein n=1 Tax=Niastella populi TaxID=550983 RepID=A0A1V9G4Y8_9BACT|nr:hypothetical protein A4R26_14360 [Niastella populi]